MFVGIMELHLVLFDDASIKDKRSVVKRVAHRCRNTFNVSVAETDDQDCLDRATLAVVAVSSSHAYVQGMLEKIEDFVERLAIAEVLDAPKLVEHY